MFNTSIKYLKFQITFVLIIIFSVNTYSQNIDKALEYFQSENYEQAIKEFEKIIDESSTTYTDNEIATIQLYIALCYEKTNNYNKAEKHYILSIEKFKNASGEIDYNIYSVALNNLGLIYANMGQYEKALPLQNEILEITKATFGETHPDYATRLNNLAHLYSKMGQYEKALPLYEEALEISKASLGEAHPKYASMLNNLALLHFYMGQYEKALPLYEEALKLTKAFLGEMHPSYATFLNNLAQLYLNMGQHEKALPLQEEALEITKATLGKTHPDYAERLNNLAGFYYNMGQYEKALSLFEEALEIRKATVGETHPDYATSLSNLASLYSDMGQYEKALPLQEEALEITKASLGETHPDYGRNLNNLAQLYSNMGQYEKALPLQNEALEVTKATLGETHPNYATSLSNLASLYSKMGQYEKALPLQEEALEITKASLGETHPDYALSLNDLALLYSKMGQYEKALSLFEEALEISKATVGETHPDYATSLNNLASLYSDMGQYEKALSLLEEALEISKATVGETHPNYASILSDLASLYSKMGQYEKALPLYEETLEIRKATVGETHPDYATSLNNLASLYFDMGQYEKALSLLEEALEIRKAAVGETHPHYAIILNNLAALYSKIGQYEIALPLYEETLEITKATVGETHPNYASSLSDLASLYSDMGQYEKALPLLEEALEITKVLLGETHCDYATSLNNLAALYYEMGQYEKALPLQNEVLEITKVLLGETHPDYSTRLNNLALLYINMGQSKKALPLLFKQIDILKYNTENNFTVLSEKEKMEYIKTINSNFQMFNSFALRNQTINDSIDGYVYNNSLTNNGIILHSSVSMNNAILNSGDTSLIKKYDDWLLIKKVLAKLYSLQNDKRFADTDSLENIANKLEGKLVRESSGFSDFNKEQNVNWQDIRNNLQDNEAAIEFINFDYYDKRWTDSTYYCALVLRKDYEHPKMIYLFEEKQLNSIISSLSSGNSAQLVSNLYGQTRGVSVLGGNTTITTYGDSLYNMIWQPLDSLLQGVERVYYSPSGLLHNISFSAIPVNDSTLLMDRYNLSLMSTTADIVLNKEPDFNNAIAAVYGGIIYDLTPEEMEASTKKYRDKENDLFAYTRGWVYNDTLRGGGWSYLNGTLTEAEEISETLADYDFRVATYTGAKANEESFKALSGKNSPEIIHLATHGFFFPDPKKQKRRDNLMFQQMGDNAYSLVDNPLMRSGLLFAGANTVWSGGEIPGELEDGVLTAYEVSNMDLFNTKLVTLSACETGLGDIKGTEGVYGLQRSFKMAGVDYLIMSLWQVPDKETQEFMSLFYKNLTSGQPIAEAFRNTQKVMRQKYEPFYWAGFVLLE